MNIFKTFVLLWWQVGLLKITLLALGIAIGAHWSTFFSRYIAVLLVVAVAAGGYISYVWFMQ